MEYYTVNGIMFRECDGIDEIQRGESSFQFKWYHIPTSTFGTRFIAMPARKTGEAQFIKLLKHWNNQSENWIYAPI